MKGFYIALALLSFTACIPKSQLKPTLIKEFLHDGNSKVWEVESEFYNNKKLQKPRPEEQKTFTFFKDKSVYLQERLHLGGFSGVEGKYTLKFDKVTNDTLFQFIFKGKRYKFTVNTFNKNQLNLSPLEEYKSFKKMHLVPLRKPF